MHKFKLQQILDYREDQKKSAEEKLAKKRCELESIERELYRLQGKKKKLDDFQRENQVRQLNIYTLRAIESYYLFLQENFQQKKQEYACSQEQVEKKREALLACWRNCQVLEKLKEKAFDDFIEEEKKREQSLNDEISLSIYNKGLLGQGGGESRR